MITSARNRQAGITLIEVLVVLAVIGVATGALMMGMGDRGRSTEIEATRLARHLTLGVDEAMLSGAPLVLQWDVDGYRFGQMPAEDTVAPDAWPAAKLPALGLRHDLARAVDLRLPDTATASPVILPVSGAATTTRFQLAGAGVSWIVTFDGFSAVAAPEDPL